MFVKCILLMCIVGTIVADYPCTIPKLENGKVKVRQRGRFVMFMCLSRYTLVGNKYATCRDEHWDVVIPVCIRSGCPTLPDLENGIQIPSYFNAWTTFFCLPGYRLQGSPTVHCDGRKWNASIPLCLESKLTTPLNCDFENADMCGFANSELHDFDWERINGKTPSSLLKTGPSFDHTYGKDGSGYYMYIETTSRYENDTARLLSPIFDRHLFKDAPCLSFYYHMYGNSIGGLKVFIKPDYLDLEQLVSPIEENKKYLLFEKWGNMGDMWYNSVSKLPDVKDNFQIVIEGIRGHSFTSDIAIDDFAILQGNECKKALESAVAPTPTSSDSCNNRCFVNDTSTFVCSCSKYCFNYNNCCVDYFDICLFQRDPATTESSDGSEIPDTDSQTQKIAVSTPETTVSTTSTTTRTTSRTTTSTAPTPRATSTTAVPTPTTIKTTSRTIKKTTPTTTSSTPTTGRQIITAKTVKTTKQPSSTAKTTLRPTGTKTTSTYEPISRTIENHNDYHDIVEKAKKEKEIKMRQLAHKQSQDSGISGLKIFLIILVVTACMGVTVWLVLVARSRRGREAVARFTGRINRDQEVRFLSTDVDDD